MQPKRFERGGTALRKKPNLKHQGAMGYIGDTIADPSAQKPEARKRMAVHVFRALSFVHVEFGSPMNSFDLARDACIKFKKQHRNVMDAPR